MTFSGALLRDPATHPRHSLGIFGRAMCAAHSVVGSGPVRTVRPDRSGAYHDPVPETPAAPESGALDDIEIRYPDEQLAVKMGIEITGWDPARMTATMPVAGNRQPFGLMHGGASGVLAETLGSTAAYLNGAPGAKPVGLELSCTHHRAATDGVVTAVCTPLSLGRTVATFEIVVSDDQGRRVCTSKLTCLYRHRPPGG